MDRFEQGFAVVAMRSFCRPHRSCGSADGAAGLIGHSQSNELDRWHAIVQDLACAACNFEPYEISRSQRVNTPILPRDVGTIGSVSGLRILRGVSP